MRPVTDQPLTPTAARASANTYHFITQWRVKATLDEVNLVLGDAGDLSRWWPSVYLEVRQLAPGDAKGIGREG